MCGHSLRGNREVRAFPWSFNCFRGRLVKEKFRTTRMNNSRNSDNNIVPGKLTNKKYKALRSQWREGR
jgi:NADH:ubiquinone oxidoreductase subunit B-like Fe-S oxidoreductase